MLMNKLSGRGRANLCVPLCKSVCRFRQKLPQVRGSRVHCIEHVIVANGLEPSPVNQSENHTPLEEGTKYS